MRKYAVKLAYMFKGIIEAFLGDWHRGMQPHDQEVHNGRR